MWSGALAATSATRAENARIFNIFCIFLQVTNKKMVALAKLQDKRTCLQPLDTHPCKIWRDVWHSNGSAHGVVCACLCNSSCFCFFWVEKSLLWLSRCNTADVPLVHRQQLGTLPNHGQRCQDCGGTFTNGKQGHLACGANARHNEKESYTSNNIIHSFTLCNCLNHFRPTDVDSSHAILQTRH